MIKVSILGGGSADGGELIRLLAMHPDVELKEIQAKGLEGMPVISRHHGLIGETTLSFTGAVDFQKCDVLFICGDGIGIADFQNLRMARPDLKVIFLNHMDGIDAEKFGVVYGVPEINRKLLVRGATTAEVPVSFASMALVALFPFANNLLLGNNVDIRVSAPAAILAESNLEEAAKEIERELKNVQLSFNGKVSLTAEKSSSRRSALMEINFDCALNMAQAMALYDIYDDHHFAFATASPVGVSEVAGTNKCVISVLKPDADSVALGVAADCRLRGASGEAVHIMNLMCGLHEKTGLALKAIDFEPIL